MDYRFLGNTSLMVSAIGIGCGNVGGLFTREPSSQVDQELAETAASAVEMGINWFDTASQYGEGRSETNLGRALREAGLRDVLVATKVRLSLDDVRDTAGAVRREAEASLERLGLDKVALFQLHNPVCMERGSRRGALGLDDVLARRGALEALERLRSEGMCLAIGFTALGETKALVEVIRSQGFGTAQVYYNLLNATASQSPPPGFDGQNYGRILEAMGELRMGTFNIRVLAAGALADPHREPLLGPALSPGSDFGADLRKADALGSLARKYEVPLAQAALRFGLQEPLISCVLVGISNVTQMEQAVDAVAEGPLPEGFLEECEAILATDFHP